MIAILLFFGVGQLLGTMLGEWLRTHQTIVGVIQLSCAGLSMIGLVWWTIQWYQKVRLASEPPDLARKPTVLSSPWFILGLAIVSTLYDSPSAIPLFWFLGMLTQFAVQTTYAIPLLIVYCFIYIIPMVVLYVLYDRMTGQTFKNFEQRFQMIVRRVTYYSIPLFLLAVSIWMVWDGWARL
jgi:cytochrome c biogenesis protein CcdA